MKRYLVTVVVVDKFGDDEDQLLDFGKENRMLGGFNKRLNSEEIERYGYHSEKAALKSWPYTNAIETGHEVFVCEVDV